MASRGAQLTSPALFLEPPVSEFMIAMSLIFRKKFRENETTVRCCILLACSQIPPTLNSDETMGRGDDFSRLNVLMYSLERCFSTTPILCSVLERTGVEGRRRDRIWGMHERHGNFKG